MLEGRLRLADEKEKFSVSAASNSIRILKFQKEPLIVYFFSFLFHFFVDTSVTHSVLIHILVLFCKARIRLQKTESAKGFVVVIWCYSCSPCSYFLRTYCDL